MPDAIQRNGTGGGSGCRHLSGGDAMSKASYIDWENAYYERQALLDEYVVLRQISREEFLQRLDTIRSKSEQKQLEDRPCAT